MRTHINMNLLCGLLIGLVVGMTIGTSMLALAQLWPSPYDETNQQIWQQQQQANQMETLQRLRQQDFQRQIQEFPAHSRPPC